MRNRFLVKYTLHNLVSYGTALCYFTESNASHPFNRIGWKTNLCGFFEQRCQQETITTRHIPQSARQG